MNSPLLPSPECKEASFSDEPGSLSVLGEIAVRGIQFAVFGALAGIAVCVGAAMASSPESVLGFMQDTFGLAGSGTGMMGVASIGASLGAIGGAMVGAPLGGMCATSQLKHYYHNVALHRVHEQAMQEGIQLGAQLEQSAMQHEIQSSQIRDAIKRRDPSFAVQAAHESTLQQTLQNTRT